MTEQFDILKYATIIQMEKQIIQFPILDGTGRMCELRARETDIKSLFLTGNGIMEPLGILSHHDTALVERWSPDAICFDDLHNMMAEFFPRGRWLFSPSAHDAMLEIRYVDGGQVFDSKRKLLFGMPVHKCSHSPALGKAGDVVLADFGSYIIGRYVNGESVLYGGIPNNTIVKTFKKPVHRFVMLGEAK